MSKVKGQTQEQDVKLSDNHVKEPTIDFKGKTNEELIEVRDTLISQLNQYHTMTIKATGALEILNQLLPEKDNNDS